MSDSKTAKRLEALVGWAELVAADGFQVPTADELADIAANPNDWAERKASPVLAAWAATVDHLLHQVKFGVNPAVAVDQLPEELRRPVGDAAKSAPTPLEPPDPASLAQTAPADSAPPAHDARTELVEALMRWRATRIADGAEGAELIKDVTLKNLVKFGHTDGEQIGKKLPGPAAYLGAEIAAIIGQHAANIDTDPTPQREPGIHDIETETSAPVIPPPVDVPSAAPPPQREPFSPVPPTARHARTDDALLHLSHSDFSEYEYGESAVVPGPVTVKTTAEGLRLTFEPFVAEAGKLVIYRVVSGDDVEPFKPEIGDLVAVTTALQVDDNRYLASAVRHYQVWCHVGSDLEDARRSQPFLLARGEEVCPVDEFIVVEDEGRVIGQWSAHPGTRAVRVYRIPLEGTGPRGNDPHNQICTEQPNLTGFVDTEAQRGVRYLYRALAEVNVGSSVRLSSPKQQEILVSVVLTGVEDLDIVVSDDYTEFDLSWSTPANGRVQIYRSETPPLPGLEGSEMPEEALAVQGFAEDARIKHPVVATADPLRSGMKGVPWPTAWERTYLTPVTVLAGTARVGQTRVETRPLPPVADPEIIERFDTEVVRFGWPAGAAAVQAFVGSASTPPEEIVARGQAWAEINSAHYRRDGGLTFARPLAAKGCTVCLIPVNYSRGEQVRGQLSALHYPGLHRIRYALAPLEVPTRHIRALWLDNDLDLDSAVVLVMVNRQDRFPLSADDGDPVYFLPSDGGDPRPQCLITQLARGQHDTGWRVDWTQHRGFFRIFLTEATDRGKRYAVADPPMEQLYLHPAIGTPQ